MPLTDIGSILSLNSSTGSITSESIMSESVASRYTLDKKLDIFYEYRSLEFVMWTPNKGASNCTSWAKVDVVFLV